MFKKICCMLLVSLCAVGVMVGCGKNKTPENISNMYIEIKTDKDNAYIFKKGDDGVVSNQLYITYSGEMAKLLKDGAPVETDFEAAKPLYRRYYALRYFEQGVLTSISEYYDKYCSGDSATSFYEAIKLKDVEKAELNALCDATEGLKTDIRKFEVARKKVRDMQVKYLYDGNDMPEDASVKMAYVNRLRDEFYLNSAQAIYYKALKAFDRTNECDLGDLPIEKELYVKFYNILNKKGDFVVRDLTKEQVETKDGEIEEFLYAHNAFLQKFEVYKKVYVTLDYYTYNQKLILSETELENYKKVLSDVDRANVSLIESFENTIFGEYCDKFLVLGR